MWSWPPQAYDDMPLEDAMSFFALAVEQSERNNRPQRPPRGKT